MLIKGEALRVWEQGGYMEKSLYFPLNFAVNLKLFLKENEIFIFFFFFFK